MKKIVALLLALMLCLGSFPAFADVDLSAYTQEELLALRDLINQELLKRGIEKEVIVPQGTYFIGEDIPAGIYSIKGVSYMGGIEVFDRASDPFPSFSGVVTNYDDNAETIGKLALNKGNMIVVLYGSLIFSPYQGLGF